MFIQHRSFIVGLFLLILINGCSTQKDDGLVKHQVRGSVLVNGERLPKVIVMFNNTDPTIEGNASRPVAATNESGEYVLSTNGTADGAILGEYRVTFELADSNPTSTKDYFRGKFANIKQSKFIVNIVEGENVIPPFELKVNKDWLPSEKPKFASGVLD